MNVSNDSRTKRAAEWIIKNETACFSFGLGFAVVTFICAGFWIAGHEIEPVTFILSLIASFFFALPPIAKRTTEARPIERMNFNEIMQLVANSDRDEWRGIDSDDGEERFFLRDPKLRIIHLSGEKGTQNHDFKADWANQFISPEAKGIWFDISYDGSLLKRVLLVCIDGYRARVPCPLNESTSIEGLSYKVGLISAYHVDLYLEYLEKLKFEIEK